MGMVRLENGRVQVGHRGAAGGDDRHRDPTDLRHAEGEEPRRPFVDAHVQPKSSGLLGLERGVRQRRRSGAGSQDDVTYAVPDELVDQHGREGHGGVHGVILP